MVANLKSRSFLPGLSLSVAPSKSLTRAAAGPLPRVSFKVLFMLAGGFWLFVTFTDVLYGYSMQVNAEQVFKAVMFINSNERVLQHLLLFPILVLCFSLSLRIGWAPVNRVPVQILLGGVFAALSYPAMALSEFLIWGSLMPRVVVALWTASFVMFFMTYCFGIVLVTGFAYYQRLRDAEVRNSALEQGWTNARLAALRMQLSPHTLFNLLHTIRGHINKEPQVARAMVVQLADLLRRLLSASQCDFVSLPEELTFVRLYLELQQQRFAERLTIVLPPAENFSDLWVPSLILQPLVENAVVHGLAGHEAAVLVRVEAEAHDGAVILRVINTTAKESIGGPNGIGLNNVRERLDVQFGADASFTAGPTAPGEWTAEIALPIVNELSPRARVANASGHKWMS
jgi:two-component system, LytTR family, sensor kinase